MPPLLPPASPKGTSSPSCRLPFPGRAPDVGAGGTGDAGAVRGPQRGPGGDGPGSPPGAPRAMPVQLVVPQAVGSRGAGAVLLSGAVAVVAHLRRGCFSVAAGGTPRFLHRRPRCFLRLQL